MSSVEPRPLYSCTITVNYCLSAKDYNTARLPRAAGGPRNGGPRAGGGPERGEAEGKCQEPGIHMASNAISVALLCSSLISPKSTY